MNRLAKGNGAVLRRDKRDSFRTAGIFAGKNGGETRGNELENGGTVGLQRA
jgi:hypothetical protein